MNDPTGAIICGPIFHLPVFTFLRVLVVTFLSSLFSRTFILSPDAVWAPAHGGVRYRLPNQPLALGGSRSQPRAQPPVTRGGSSRPPDQPLAHRADGSWSPVQPSAIGDDGFLPHVSDYGLPEMADLGHLCGSRRLEVACHPLRLRIQQRPLRPRR